MYISKSFLGALVIAGAAAVGWFVHGFADVISGPGQRHDIGGAREQQLRLRRPRTSTSRS